MPTTSIRWALVKRMADTFANNAEIGGCVVHSFPPGELDLTDEMLVATKVTSTTNSPTSGGTGGRLQRDEFVTIEWSVWVNGRTTVDQTMVRFDEIAAVVEDVMADDSTFAGLDGVLDGQVVSTEVNATRATDGFYVLGTVTTEIHTRLT